MLNRRAAVLPLRGSDPTLLEVQLSDIVRRPIGQIAPTNVMDLIELAGTEGCPKALDKPLQAFVDGVRRQVADIPRGRSWELFLDELEVLTGNQVPLLFREMLLAEAEGLERAKPRVVALVERWSADTPDAFLLSVRKARVQRAEMVQPKAPAGDPSSAPRERGAARSKSSSGKTGSGPKLPKPVADIDRRDFVVEQCIERLGRTSDKGLLEIVLVAGVRHAGREQYPDMTAVEVRGVLATMRDANRVRSSAGRWSLITRF